MSRTETMTSEQYNDAIAKAYEFAVEYITDETTAQKIMEDVKSPYGLAFLMPAEEWYSKTPEEWEQEYVTCLIGQDVALDWFVVSAF
jgi:hypothetical protein